MEPVVSLARRVVSFERLYPPVGESVLWDVWGCDQPACAIRETESVWDVGCDEPVCALLRRSSARVPKPGDPWEEEYLIAQRASLLPTDAYKRASILSAHASPGLWFWLARGM
eukprot:2787888-Rhodomonas_salina.2